MAWMEHDSRSCAEFDDTGWTVPSAFVPLAKDGVQVWRVWAVPDGPLYQACHEMLQAEELSRLGRLRVGMGRDEFVVARGCLRLLLGAALGLNPQNIVLGAGQHGKPYTAGIEFNVTHSKGLILIALSRGAAVGIDVESIDPGIEALEIAQDTFAPKEIAHIADASPEEKPNVFYRYWVRKEAVTKAHGQGITLSLKGFEVDPNDIQDTVRLTDETTGAIRCLHVRCLPLEGDFVGALAIQSPKSRMRLFDLSLGAISKLSMTPSEEVSVERGINADYLT